MTAPLLEVRDLVIEYLLDKGSFVAVDTVSFEIGRGEIFGLAGESGCGKSTIAYAITQLPRPPAWVRQGEIRFDGTDLLRLDEASLQKLRWRRTGMVFQSAMNSLNPLLRIERQFFDVLYRHTGCSRAEGRAKAEAMLRLVGIDPKRVGDYPHQFSGGMRQRLVIAICLALEPDLIIMDEPTTALDVVVQREILQQICDLQARLGFSVLFITHDLHLMSQFCDRIAVMLTGRIVEQGPVDQITRAPQHDYTRRLWDAIPRLPAVAAVEGGTGAPADALRERILS